mgnify:CR=1 FL=1
MSYSYIISQAISIDLSLANLLYAVRDPVLVKVFLGLTLLGKWQIALAIMLAAAAFFWIWQKKNYIIPIFISVGGSFFTGFFGKIIWQRPRPLAVAVYVEHSWSFPSGHAILAVSLYGFLIYFFWKNFKKRINKIAALFFGLLIILTIGFSRLYLGVHYLSDVLACYLVGIFLLVISIVVVNKKSMPVSTPEIIVKKEEIL